MNDDLRRKIPHMIALGRIIFGLGTMASPTAGSLLFLGVEANRPSVRFMSRIFGVRDLAVGVVLLQALRDERSESVTQALLLGAGCDAWDAVTALRARDLPLWGRAVVAVLGSTFAALGVTAALSPPLEPDPASIAPAV